MFVFTVNFFNRENMMFISVMEGVSNETNLLKRSAVKNRMIPETKQIKICGSTAAERKQKILTRLPSKQQLRWLWTLKLIGILQ